MTGEESLHGELIARGYASDGISEDDGAAVAAIVGTAATADCGRINALSMKIPLFTSRLKKAGQGGAVPDFFLLMAQEPVSIIEVGYALLGPR
jgi:hypothetical protein